MPVKLKPCPFCGSKDVQIGRIGSNRASCIVSCECCGCQLESNEIGYGCFWNERADTKEENSNSSPSGPPTCDNTPQAPPQGEIKMVIKKEGAAAQIKMESGGTASNSKSIQCGGAV